MRSMALILVGIASMFSPVWSPRLEKTLGFTSYISSYWWNYVLVDAATIVFMVAVLYREIRSFYRIELSPGFISLCVFALCCGVPFAIAMVVSGGCQEASFTLPYTIATHLSTPIVEELAVGFFIQYQLTVLFLRTCVPKKAADVLAVATSLSIFVAAHRVGPMEGFSLALVNLPFRLYVQATWNVGGATIAHIIANLAITALHLLLYHGLSVPFCSVS